MGLPDYQLDEPDERLCEEHGRPVPCWICQREAEEYRQDCLREDGE